MASATSKDRDDFDRSFDFFQSQIASSEQRDPWAEKLTVLGVKQNVNNTSGDTTSFEDDLFEFTATSSVQVGDFDEPDESQSFFFPTDPFGTPITEKRQIVRVAIHEQLSALYDDISSDPACQVDGRVLVQTPTSKSTTEPIRSFCLLLRDLFGHLDRCDLKDSVCEDITSTMSPDGLHKTDRVLKIRLPNDAPANDEISILTYTCSQSLRPVPMVGFLQSFL